MTRRHITLLLFLLSSNLLFSQIFKILHGTSFRGGENNTGTVFYQNPDNPSDFKSLSFDKVGPVSPVGGIMEASDGFLYLTTFSGGDFNLGTIVKLDADASNPTVIHHFNGAEGASTYATLTEGTDGNLYGTTYEGGMNDAGTVFKVGKDGTGFTVLHHFNGTDGLNPWGGVMEGSDGTLYGTTELGGAQDFGTLFKINTDGSGFEVLREFDRLIDGTISYGSRRR